MIKILFIRKLMDKISKKHQAFINAYFECNMNGTRAYLKTHPGVTYDTARTNAARLLSYAYISEEVEKRMKENQMTADEVIRRLSEQARCDYSQYLGPTGFVDLPKMIEEGKAHLIQKVKQTKEGLEVEFYNGQTALMAIGKQLGLLDDRHIIEMRLEKEVDTVLSILEEVLSKEDYDRVLSRLTKSSFEKTTSDTISEDL